MYSPEPSGTEEKAQFRKLSNDAVNRKYRRHYPADGSSSPDESPKHEHGSSPNLSQDDSAKLFEHRRSNKEHERQIDRESNRNYRGKGGDYHRNSDRRSLRESHRYPKHEDYRRDKYANREEQRYQGSHSGRNTRSDHAREEGGHGRPREYIDNKYSHERYKGSGHISWDRDREALPKDKDISPHRFISDRELINSISEENDKDRHSHDKSGRDEGRDYSRSSRYQKSDRALYHEDNRGHRNEYRGKDNSGHHVKEFNDDDTKETNTRQERKKQTGWDTDWRKDQDDQTSREQEDKAVFGGDNHTSPAKRPKLLNLDKDGDEKQSLSAKQAEEMDGKATMRHENVGNSVAAAATVAAMKAAELVNRNLVGTGFMSTEQKKKLLWGNKKSTTAEQFGTQWNASLFGDRERQEKFNKLMGVKSDVKGEHIPENSDGGHLLAEKQKELQIDLEKQYTAGLRRRDGRTVGLGL